MSQSLLTEFRQTVAAGSTTSVGPLDLTNPEITINRPYEGARYSKDADPKPDLTSDYECTDADSGIASCVGTVARRRPLRPLDSWHKDLHRHRHRQRRQYRHHVGHLPRLRLPRTHRRRSPDRLLPTRRPLGLEDDGSLAQDPSGYYQNEQDSEPFGISGDGDAARYFYDFDSNGVGDGHGYANNIQAPRSYTLSAFFRIKDGGRSQMILEHGGAGSIWYHAEAGHNHLHFRPVVWDGVRLNTPRLG